MLKHALESWVWSVLIQKACFFATTSPAMNSSGAPAWSPQVEDSDEPTPRWNSQKLNIIPEKVAIPKKKLSSSCGTITSLQSRTARFRGCILHSTWDLQATYYCWWKKSYTGWYGEYHMFHDRWCRISFINSSTDFLPEPTRILPQRSGEVSIVKRKMVVPTSVAKFHHVYLSPGKIFSPKCSYVEPKASATPPSPSHCFWHFAGHGTAKQFWLHSVQVPYLELSPGRSPLRFHIIKTSGILKLLAFIKKI